MALVVWKATSQAFTPFDLPTRDFHVFGRKVVIEQGEGIPQLVWDGSHFLVAYFERAGVELSGRRVIDLGSGTGLLPIALASVAERVVATDLPKALSLMRKNAQRNGLGVEGGNGEQGNKQGQLIIQALPWGDRAACRRVVEEHGPFDVVCATDVVYIPELFDALVASMDELLRLCPAATLYLAYYKRYDREARFFERAQECFDVRKLPSHLYPPEFSHSDRFSLWTMKQKAQ